MTSATRAMATSNCRPTPRPGRTVSSTATGTSSSGRPGTGTATPAPGLRPSQVHPVPGDVRGPYQARGTARPLGRLLAARPGPLAEPRRGRHHGELRPGLRSGLRAYSRRHRERVHGRRNIPVDNDWHVWQTVWDAHGFSFARDATVPDREAVRAAELAVRFQGAQCTSS